MFLKSLVLRFLYLSICTEINSDLVKCIAYQATSLEILTELVLDCILEIVSIKT